MSTVSIREAKNKFTELTRRVEAGERVTITRHGKPVAELVPPTPMKGGINWEAGDAYLKAHGRKRPVIWIAEDFDDPLPEDFLITPITFPDER